MLTRITGFIAILICVNPVFAQLKGTVTDKVTSAPLSGVHILAENESTITDLEGKFSLLKTTGRIVFTHLGYVSDTLIINTVTDDLRVQLIPLAIEIDQYTIRGSFNEFSIMQLPSSAGSVNNLDKPGISTISFIEDLNSIPGVFVNSGTLNTNRITIRGIGSRTPYGTNRIKAYYEDIPLTTGDGTTEIEDINASSIESVEVLKGSKSALYGSGLGGVIMLKKPEYDSGTHVLAGMGMSSFKTLQSEVSLTHKKNGFYLNGGLAHAQTDGWRQNSAYERMNITLNSGYTDNKNQVDFLLLSVKTRAQIPSSINLQTFTNAPDSAARNWLSVQGFEEYSKTIAGLSYKRSLSERFSNRTVIFAQTYNGYESRPFNILDDESVRYGFRNISALQIENLKIQAGVETMIDRYQWNIFETQGGEQGDMLSSFAENRRPLSIFLNGQYRFRKGTILEAGISVNALRYSLVDQFEDGTDLSGAYSYDLVYSPFVGVNMPVNERVRLYSSVGHGFSAPTVEETLLPDGMINPDLKPETGLNAEVGMRFMSKDRSLVADLCVYGMQVSDLLVTMRETEDIFYGANAGKTLHRGLELSSSFQQNETDSRFPVSLSLNYSIQKATFTDYIDDGVDYSGRALPGIPGQNLYFLSNISSRRGFFLLPIFQYTGRQFMDDANDMSYGSWYLVHLKAGYTGKIGRAGIRITLGVENMLDSDYASMILVNAPSFGALPRYYYPGAPRNYSLTVKVDL